MLNTIENTDFSFLGDRNYINSTSIIEFIHNNINVFITVSGFNYSLNIKIYKEVKTNCRVDTYSSYHEYDKDLVVCEAILSSNNDIKYLYFISNNKQIKKNKLDSKYGVYDLKLNGRFSGSCYILSSNYTEFIRNIIQANKILHVKNIGFSEYKILNIFMKNVPVELDNYQKSLGIKIDNTNIHELPDGNISTLSKISFNENDIDPLFVGFQVLKL